MSNVNVLNVLEENFLDFAEELVPNNLPSVCDGLLPVHRKMIYALNEAGITHDKPFKKMLIASSEVMKYYVFGDGPLTSAMKNAGSNFMLMPYLDPKGSYPDKNRKDGVGAAPRYIECRLSEYGQYLLDGIGYHNVPFVPNWDESRTEPIYLPSPVPNILVNNSESISVGFASKIPSHNLNEVCDSFINYLKTNDIESSIDLIKGCDSPLGAELIYDKDEVHKIMSTGRGSYQMISKWEYDKKQSKITITEIPMSTVIEDIDAKIREGIEKGKLREITDVHDNSGKDGLKYDIYIRKNADVNVVISKLRKHTPFQSSVPIYLYMIKPDGVTPHLYTLKEIIEDWTGHRKQCIKNELIAEAEELERKAHRMEGLLIIAKDLQKATDIIRNAKNEKAVKIEFKANFMLDDEQIDYVSQIRAFNLNKEWIEKQTKDYTAIGTKIQKNYSIAQDDKKIIKVIIKQLEEAKEKFGMERKSKVLYDVDKNVTVDIVDDYNCYITATKEGYVKKTMRPSDNHKIKEGDTITVTEQTTNKSHLLVFTNKANMYTVKMSSLDESVPSSLGQYLPSMLNFEADEEVIAIIPTTDYSGSVCFAFDNGKVARVEMESYKTSLKKMTKAFNTKANLVSLCAYRVTLIVLYRSKNGYRVAYDLANVNPQKSRSTQGVAVMKVKKDDSVESVEFTSINDPVASNYLVKSAAVGKRVK